VNRTGLLDKWTTLRSAAAALRVEHLPTAPATTAATGWFPFRLSNGSLFGCQGAGRKTKLVPFSIIKWYPFRLPKTVAYIPDGRVIGLSKIPRIVDMFARRFQIQERMTSQIADFIEETLRGRRGGGRRGRAYVLGYAWR
jgi:hypothetical protein